MRCVGGETEVTSVTTEETQKRPWVSRDEGKGGETEGPVLGDGDG